MIVVVGVAFLVLAAAVGALFAMLGELASRIPPADGGSSDFLAPLEEYRPGAVIDQWPDGLAALAAEPTSALLVLSTVCATCDRVAADLAQADRRAAGTPVGVLVSCPDESRGAAFVAKHGLQAVPHLVDTGGGWSTGRFGVNRSPSVLLFKEGTLTSAYSFGSYQALRKKLDETMEVRTT